MSEVTNNVAASRFESEDDGYLSIAEYIQTPNGKLILPHTEVPEPVEGHGIATKLAKAAFSYARENNLEVVPICRFMADFAEQYHDEYADVLPPGFSAQ